MTTTVRSARSLPLQAVSALIILLCLAVSAEARTVIPAAPARAAAAGDSLRIDTSYDCSVLTVDITTVSSNPAGLGSIRLDSAINAYLMILDPEPPEGVTGKTRAKVVVQPVDLTKSASGIVVIEDRTGKRWSVRYAWSSPGLTTIPRYTLDLGDVSLNVKQRRTVAVVNTGSTPVPIDTLLLSYSTQVFSIVSTTPAVSHDPNNRTLLKPGDTLTLTIEVNPTIPDMSYIDTLTVTSDCLRLTLALLAQTVQPCIYVDNLDFGQLAPGQQKSLPLNICNKGQGELLFRDPWLTWLQKEFTVSQADIDKLKTAVLKENDCIQITVTFKAGQEGEYREVAHFQANAIGCRDTSIWKALVWKSGPHLTGYDWGQVRVTKKNPCTKNTVESYKQDALLTNDGNSPITVVKVELLGPDADQGFFKLDSATVPPIGVGEVLSPGLAGRAQRIIFTPAEERQYSCTIRVIVVGTKQDTVEAVLRGLAVDAHLRVVDHDFGLYQFNAPNDPTLPGTTTIIATGGYPLTLTSVRVDDGLDFSVSGMRRSNGSPATLPITLAPGDVLNVDLLFHPQAAAPEIKSAELTVEGDFSRCDDSTGLLRAGVTPAGVAVTGDDRGGALAVRIEPNPVRSEAAIALLLPARAHTTAEIFNAAGVRMATLVDGVLDAGEQVLRWNTAGAPSGLYYCRITSGVRSLVRPIVVMR